MDAAPENRQLMSDEKTYPASELNALWDDEDPTSIPKIVPPYVGEKIIKAYKDRPDLFVKNENELVALLVKEGARPTATDRRLRLSFWEEYNRVVAGLDDATTRYTRTMSIDNVVRGVCGKSYFTETYLKYPTLIAFLVCPPASYVRAIEESLTYGLDQLREILEIPNTDDVTETNRRTGVTTTVKVPNYRIMELKAKIVMALHQQTKGSLVKHEIDQKTMILTGSLGQLNKGRESVSTITHRMSVDEIDSKLKQLERQAAKQHSLLKLEGETKAEYEASFGVKTGKSANEIEAETLEDELAEHK